MRFVRTGRTEHEIREAPDVTHCTGCGAPFRPGLFSLGTLRCPCTPSGSHRTYRCADCATVSHDPPHPQPVEPMDPGGITLHRGIDT